MDWRYSLLKGSNPGISHIRGESRRPLRFRFDAFEDDDVLSLSYLNRTQCVLHGRIIIYLVYGILFNIFFKMSLSSFDKPRRIVTLPKIRRNRRDKKHNSINQCMVTKFFNIRMITNLPKPKKYFHIAPVVWMHLQSTIHQHHPDTIRRCNRYE